MEKRIRMKARPKMPRIKAHIRLWYHKPYLKEGVGVSCLNQFEFSFDLVRPITYEWSDKSEVRFV